MKPPSKSPNTGRQGHLTELLPSEWVAAPLAAVLMGVAFSYPLVLHPATPGVFHDWDFSLQLQWAAYHTIARYHQLPLWNPWKCGGMPLLGNPQSHFLSPCFLLTMIFGAVAGLHLEVPAHFIAAWLGTYLLGRVLSMRPFSAAAAACAFSTSSWFNLHACEGHIVFLPIAYAPWALAFAIIGCAPNRIGASIAAGAMLALAFFEGGGYPPVFIAIVLVVVLATLSVALRSFAPSRSLLIAILFAAGFAAVKALPGYDVLQAHPRPTPVAYVTDWSTIWTAMFSRNQDLLRASFNSVGFHEMGAYIGLFAIPALIGLTRVRRALPWALAAIVMILLARGDSGRDSLWSLFHALPIGSEMRLPSRFLMMVPLAVGVLAGFGFDMILSTRRPGASILAVALLIVAVLDNFAVTTPNLNYALQWQVSPSPPRADFRQYGLPPREVAGHKQLRVSMYQLSVENLGNVGCYEYEDNWKTPVIGAEQPEYHGEAYMAGPGLVQLTRWTPNRLEYETDLPGAGILVVNQNYDPGWRATGGISQPISERGLLAVSVPPGKRTIQLEYLPGSFEVGSAITILTVLAAFAIPKWLMRRG
ncbi:MAG TPA: hypothetical protein VMT58_03040 [Candidatus Binataceae bacterium]|nr:hypothetical protein [Candidatus Binataceae bacterium]